MAAIILENAFYRLEVGSDAVVRSLVVKASGEECIDAREGIALFSVTQERPYNNEIKLAYPTKHTVFQANAIRREENRLIVGFELIPYEAVIELTETDSYISFTLADFIVKPKGYHGLNMDTPPVIELRLLQLPVKNRAHFGQWLNVVWDESAAVCTVAASPHARIDSEPRKEYRVLTADAVRDVQLKGTTVALVACKADALMDCIAAVEEDYDLPRGVESRRNPLLNASIYWVGDKLTFELLDEYIEYAKLGGFRMMLIYYDCLFDNGHLYDKYNAFNWTEAFPNGLADLAKMVEKIKAAGIVPGFHFLHTHIGTRTAYVTPVCDQRIRKKRWFTLAKPLNKEAATVYVTQNPAGSPLADDCRVLQFGGELIGYEGYTTEPPYAFTGCTRGLFETNICEHPVAMGGGVVDVSEYGGGKSFYPDQDTDLPDEIAEKLAEIYNLGFEFIYMDGSEGTNPPYEFHVPNAQLRVWKKFHRQPILGEGAAKSHFSWHMLSGGNAFDIFPPATFKENISRHPLDEAPRMRDDFTRVNFGWWGCWMPGSGENAPYGSQADMYEFGSSRAAAWDCPMTIQASKRAYREHPRRFDLFEAIRRWEDVRAKNWLTEEQKIMLRDSVQEHTLLINEDGEYELQPYWQICEAPVRAFILERKGMRYVAYWHVDSEGTLALPVSADAVTVMDELNRPALAVTPHGDGVKIPIGNRRYLATALSREEITAAFQNAVFTEK